MPSTRWIGLVSLAGVLMPVQLASGCGSDTAEPVTPAPISVLVSPTTASLVAGGAQEFTATVTNDLANKGVTWAITGCAGGTAACGSLTNITRSLASYAAPATPPSGSLGVTATSITDPTRSFTARVAIAAGTSHTYNAVTDFSSTTNTNSSTWSYRYRDGLTRDGNYPLIPEYGSDTVDAWTPADPHSWRIQGWIPWIGVNRTGADVTVPGTGVLWPKGALLVHPGFDRLVVVSWLAPLDGTATVTFSFTGRHPTCGDGIRWFVEENSNSATLASGAIASGLTTGVQTVAGIRVRAGDHINFIADPDADVYCDSTELTALITVS